LDQLNIETPLIELSSLWDAESSLITHSGRGLVKDSIGHFQHSHDTGQDTKGKENTSNKTSVCIFNHLGSLKVHVELRGGLFAIKKDNLKAVIENVRVRIRIIPEEEYY